MWRFNHDTCFEQVRKSTDKVLVFFILNIFDLESVLKLQFSLVIYLKDILVNLL